MGWTSYHATNYKRGIVDRKAEMDGRFTQDERDGYPKLTVLKSVMDGSVYYAAIEVSRGGKVEEIVGVTSLTRVDNKDYCNFAYKEIEETSGPCNAKCPASILKLLTPTDNEWALEWRRKCEEYNAKKAASLTPGRLPIGTRIRFKRWDGTELTIVKMAPNRQFRRTWWYVPSSNTYLPSKRIPDTFEILKEEEAGA